jgi:hypothetical protein
MRRAHHEARFALQISKARGGTVAARRATRLAKRSKGSFAKPRNYWSVNATGNYHEDCALGRVLALEYLAHEEANRHGPCLLAWIVADMPRPLTGVEIGFLELVGLQSRAAPGRAAQITENWRRAWAAAEAEAA